MTAKELIEQLEGLIAAYRIKDDTRVMLLVNKTRHKRGTVTNIAELMTYSITKQETVVVLEADT